MHESKSGHDVRRRALAALLAVERGERGSQDAVSAAIDDGGGLPARDRGLLTELVYGTLRRQRTLDGWIGPRCSRGLVGLDERALAALRLGTYQLAFLDRVPAYAAIDATTEATRKLLPKALRGLVHGVLRRLDREKPWDGEPPRAATDLPPWIAARIRELAGEAEVPARDLLRAFAGAAPGHVHEISPGGLRELTEQGVELGPAGGLEGVATVLSGDVRNTDAFAARHVLLQDAASAAITRWLGVRPGARALDLCAGRGVKSLAMAAAGAEVTAVDVSADRLADAAALCEHAGHPLHTTLAADATAALDLPAASFDFVLVDAPCTGLGTLRRRPEIRHRRRAADALANAGTQRAILARAADLLAPDGVLVYAVCSFLPEEGAVAVDRLLRARRDLVRAPRDMPGITAMLDLRGDLRSHPANAGMDAFYAARLQRVGG